MEAFQSHPGGSMVKKIPLAGSGDSREAGSISEL